MPDEQSEEEEAWMTAVQEKFNDATNRKIKYVHHTILKEKTTCEDAAHGKSIKNAQTRRRTVRTVFEASYKSKSNALHSKEIPHFALRDLQMQIEEDEFLECKQSNAELLHLLSRESAESEMN